MLLMQIGIFRSLTNHYGKKVSWDIYTVMCNFILKDITQNPMMSVFTSSTLKYIKIWLPKDWFEPNPKIMSSICEFP